MTKLSPLSRPKRKSTIRILLVVSVALLWILVCVSLVMLLQISAPLVLPQTEPQIVEPISTPTNQLVNNSSGFIKSINEFENSPFCRVYTCIPSSQITLPDGTDHLYTIGKFPVYNEFLIEIVTVNNSIVIYGMTLDPRTITADDIEFILYFLTSIYSNEVDPRVMKFIIQNLGNHVTQICDSQWIELGSKRVWVGMVGLAPSIFISDICTK